MNFPLLFSGSYTLLTIGVLQLLFHSLFFSILIGVTVFIFLSFMQGAALLNRIH